MTEGPPARPRAVAVIPARFASTRLPGKPLLLAGGLPIIEHVRRRVLRAACFERVIVATDDARIAATVRGFGGDAAMTSDKHVTGSDRVGELLPILGADIVVNVQGDEPEICPRLLERLVARLVEDDAVNVTTAVAPLPKDRDAADPHLVKVVVDSKDRALYFSRSLIPSPARGDLGTRWPLIHVGVYAFRSATLREFLNAPLGALEQVESLEQLRLLEHGVPIGVIRTDVFLGGIDTPTDLEAFRRRLSEVTEKN